MFERSTKVISAVKRNRNRDHRYETTREQSSLFTVMGKDGNRQMCCMESLGTFFSCVHQPHFSLTVRVEPNVSTFSECFCSVTGTAGKTSSTTRLLDSPLCLLLTRTAESATPSLVPCPSYTRVYPSRILFNTFSLPFANSSLLHDSTVSSHWYTSPQLATASSPDF